MAKCSPGAKRKKNSVQLLTLLRVSKSNETNIFILIDYLERAKDESFFKGIMVSHLKYSRCKL